MKQNNIIEIKNLTIVYNEKKEDEHYVLRDFSYSFEKGKIYFIIGNSGSGKTSLITHFNGLSKSKHGEIYVDNIPIYPNKKRIKNFKKIRKTVGMVFQFPEYQLFKDTIEKDIIFGPVNLGVDKQEAKKRAKKYLQMLSMGPEFLERPPFGLSGGQKRRVAIAGILAIEPDVLVFDEPTAGLDPAGEKEMMDIILKLKSEGKTIVVITHVMDQVLEIADEVIVLGDQKILTTGTPYEIFSNKKVMKNTQMDIPKIIEFANTLAKSNKKFADLLDSQPKTIDELSQCITKIIGKGARNVK